MRILWICLFLNFVQHVHGQCALNKSLLADDKLKMCSEKETGSKYGLKNDNWKGEEYINTPELLTLFRDKDGNKFYCETNCPFNMMAGCDFNSTDCTMSFECDDHFLGVKSKLCSPPLPYLTYNNYYLNFERSTIGKHRIENPPFKAVGSDYGIECNDGKKCPSDLYCSEIYHMGMAQKYPNVSFCVEYPTKGAQLFGKMKTCAKDGDCENRGTCNLKNLIMNDPLQKGFCEHKKICVIGKPFGGIICGSGQRCPGNAWCDLDKKVCCSEDPTEITELHYCPDGVTPIQQEPNCSKVNEVNRCLKTVDGRLRAKEGICWSGRCCPNLKKGDRDKYEIGDYSYESNMMCDPLQPLPLKYVYKWCDSTTKKIFTVGVLDDFNVKLRTTRWNCKTKADCKGKNDICLNISKKRRVCYKSPINRTQNQIRFRFYLRFLVPIAVIIGLAIAAEYYF